uniref:Uncharacterized protein n=1 Tax=Arundo donax TaxID=35708 RepID=A0A0A9BYH7_ARUDO
MLEKNMHTNRCEYIKELTSIIIYNNSTTDNINGS